MQNNILEQLLRNGVIPLCCGGATCCFALYSATLAHAADLWESSMDTTALSFHDKHNDHVPGKSNTFNAVVYHHYHESVLHYTHALRQHSGACLTLSLMAAAMTREAYHDWQSYASTTTSSNNANWNELAIALWKRQRPFPFLVRPPVLATTAASLAMTHYLYGGWQLWQPEPPVEYQLLQDNSSQST